jgi:ABC-type sugar transport system ATPase subunit
MDEPLSNLDAQLREQMRIQLRELQQRLRITTVYVTHDQEEAMVLADTIAVLHEGRLAQLGPPEEVYHRPASRTVAAFFGTPNLLAGRVTEVRRREERTLARIAGAAGRLVPVAFRRSRGRGGDGGRPARSDRDEP